MMRRGCVGTFSGNGGCSWLIPGIFVELLMALYV